MTALEWGVQIAGAATVIEAADREVAFKEAGRRSPTHLTAWPVCRLRDDGWEPGREWRAATADREELLEYIAELRTYNREVLDRLGDWEGEVA